MLSCALGARVFYTDAKATVIIDGNVIDAQRAQSLGANVTPTWFLANGERYSGALPLEEVRRLLDDASPAKR